MRTISCAISLFVFLGTATSSLAQSENASNSMLRHGNYNPSYNSRVGDARRPLRINPNFNEPAIAAPKGAIHLFVRSDADARQIFTYFSYPTVAARSGMMGVYRLEVNSQGTVAAVTILKSMGPRRDARVMKACVGWRANPGSLRVVDISWQMG